MSQTIEQRLQSRGIAECLVNQHLNGRYLPKAARLAAVARAESRFDEGLKPAIDAALRDYLDRHSIDSEQAFAANGAKPEASPAPADRQSASFWS